MSDPRGPDKISHFVHVVAMSFSTLLNFVPCFLRKTYNQNICILTIFRKLFSEHRPHHSKCTSFAMTHCLNYACILVIYTHIIHILLTRWLPIGAHSTQLCVYSSVCEKVTSWIYAESSALNRKNRKLKVHQSFSARRHVRWKFCEFIKHL